MANLRVYRYNPDEDAQPHYQEYSAEVWEFGTVLDALLKVREEIDTTLSLRCSCRSAICGSCAMRINHHAALACKTKVSTIAPQGEPILVEPMGNLPVIKDLVVDMTPFWDKVKAVEPWLEPAGKPPRREYRVDNAVMLELAGVMNCIMCGACVSDCTALEVDKNFLGPAALAKAYRFTEDPRDAAGRERLRALSAPSGVWDCTHCFECVQRCPKDVAPMDRILALRRRAVEMGYTDNNGARHHQAFEESVKHAGWLDEFTLPVKSVGVFNIKELIGLAPVGLRALRAGKLPPVVHRPIPGAENVRRIFNKLEVKE
ncbi:MAG: succinate dehydrogenase iron-sulfur subunit [Chloroflexi bacterium]|nr:succinate dehydrogenase iron-sulfur subunit [Chloroflexota bacterium]